MYLIRLKLLRMKYRQSNYILILDLTPGFNGLDRENCKTRRESYLFGGFCESYIRDFTVVLFNILIKIGTCNFFGCPI